MFFLRPLETPEALKQLSKFFTIFSHQILTYMPDIKSDFIYKLQQSFLIYNIIGVEFLSSRFIYHITF